MGELIQLYSEKGYASVSKNITDIKNLTNQRISSCHEIMGKSAFIQDQYISLVRHLVHQPLVIGSTDISRHYYIWLEYPLNKNEKLLLDINFDTVIANHYYDFKRKKKVTKTFYMSDLTPLNKYIEKIYERIEGEMAEDGSQYQ